MFDHTSNFVNKSFHTFSGYFGEMHTFDLYWKKMAFQVPLDQDNKHYMKID
jgi:hypothetical protein